MSVYVRFTRPITPPAAASGPPSPSIAAAAAATTSPAPPLAAGGGGGAADSSAANAGSAAAFALSSGSRQAKAAPVMKASYPASCALAPGARPLWRDGAGRWGEGLRKKMRRPRHPARSGLSAGKWARASKRVPPFSP
jgi:hypothetical protein